MIYQPQPYFNVQASLLSALVNAIARFAADYVRGQNQPWTYYLGYGFGGAALATGIPGANAYMYAIGAGTLKIFFEKSPGAAQAEIFLDGVSQGNLDLNDEIIDIIEFVLNIPNDGQYHEVSILNLGSLVPEDATDFLSILAIETANQFLAQKEVLVAPVVVVSVTVKDAKTVSKKRVKNTATAKAYVPLGTMTLADIIGWHDAFCDAVDGVSDGQIVDSAVTIKPTLPAGLKTAPVAGSDVQEGGNLVFALTESNYTDGIWIPAYAPALFSADGQNIPNTGNTANLTGLLIGDAPDPADNAASNEFAITYSAFDSGAKAFRK